MKKVIFFLFLFATNTFAQNTTTTLIPVEGGTVKKDNINTSGVMTSATDVSFGYVTFDLGSLPKGAIVTEVTLTGFINTLNTPSTGHQASVIIKDPRKEVILYNDILNAKKVIDDWTWAYGNVQSTFNERGISEVENQIGSIISFAYSPNPTNRETFNFIAWTNTFYRPNLIVTYQLANSGAPKANFSANKFNIVEGETVNFKDSSSTAGTSWKWDFDFDNAPGVNTSSTQNPSFSFLKEGDYTIAFTATNSIGSNTKIKSNYIHVFDTPKANFGFEVNLIEPNVVSFFDSSAHKPQEWFWIFGDGVGASQEKNPVYVYNKPGDYEVCLIAQNIAGIDTICKWVHADSTEVVLGLPNSVQQKEIFLYPNPSKDLISLNISSFDSFELYTIRGQRVISLSSMQKNELLSVRDILPGVYIYKIISGNQYYSGRFIKI